MRQKIFRHGSFLVVISVLLTFVSASIVMYQKFGSFMKQGVKDEAAYLRAGIIAEGEAFLTDEIGDATESRVTLANRDGTVVYDSDADVSVLTNHSDRPEFHQALSEGVGEATRFSETLSEQTYYYAVRLPDGYVLRVARTTESVFRTLMSSFALLGILIIGILLLDFFMVQKNTRDLIQPINQLNLEDPLKNVCYEELRPLLMRVDEQNRQIARQLDELKQAESIRREFSANVSHELKTPLMSISGYAELMMNQMVPPEKIPEFSGRIYHEASRLTNLVQDVIQISRLDEQSLDQTFEEVNLYDIAQDSVEHLREAARKKRLHMQLYGESVLLRGNRQVLYEMFYNLADNAVRYTPEGGKVMITLGKKNGNAFYRVRDNGIGIAKEEQKRVFERFYRVDKSHSRETGGTGLGLSIVKHGAILHNARILLDSEPGKGTCVEICFPSENSRKDPAVRPAD